MEHSREHIALRLALRPQQAATVSLLLQRQVVSKDALYAYHYDDRPECEQPQSDKVLDKHVCILRKRLKAHSVDIASRYGVGWFFAPEDRTKLRKLLAMSDDELVATQAEACAQAAREASA